MGIFVIVGLWLLWIDDSSDQSAIFH